MNKLNIKSVSSQHVQKNNFFRFALMHPHPSKTIYKSLFLNFLRININYPLKIKIVAERLTLSNYEEQISLCIFDKMYL